MRHGITHKTERRSSAEVKLADAIDQLAATLKLQALDRAAAARAHRLTQAGLKSPLFENNRGYSAVDQLPIYYFHTQGDSVTGILGEPQQEPFMASTYPLRLESGRVIRIVAHRLLRKIVTTGKYVGRNVTITYLGKKQTRWGGHYEKLYEVKFAGDKPTDPTNDVRKGLQVLIEKLGKGRPDARLVKLLESFAGEAWADEAIAKAKEGK